MAIKYSLRQLEVFISVASLGSFTAAAEDLHISRAALGSTIDALEAALGEQLFNRRRSIGITLTPAGKQLLSGAIALLHDAARLAHTTNERQALSGELVVGATISLASSALPVLIRRLGAAHPQLKVRVIVRGADELMSILELGGLELLFSYATSTPLQRVNTELLFDARFGVIAPRARFTPHDGVLPAKSLAASPLAILDNPLSRQRLFDYLESAGIHDVDVRYRVGSLPLCIELVRSGLASAVVPLFPSMNRELPSDIACFDLDPPPMPIAATVAWHEGVPLSPAAEAAIAELRQIRQSDGW